MPGLLSAGLTQQGPWPEGSTFLGEREWIVRDGAVDAQVKSCSIMSKATILSEKKLSFGGYMNIMGSILGYEQILYRQQMGS